jgi:hypothetical protein
MTEATEDPVRLAYIALIENECNRSFADGLPPDIEHILLPYLVQHHGRDPNIASQSVSDMSVSFRTDGMPASMRRIIQKHRRVFR